MKLAVSLNRKLYVSKPCTTTFASTVETHMIVTRQIVEAHTITTVQKNVESTDQSCMLKHARKLPFTLHYFQGVGKE